MKKVTLLCCLFVFMTLTRALIADYGMGTLDVIKFIVLLSGAYLAGLISADM